MTEGKQKFIIFLLIINLIVVSYFGVSIKNKIDEAYVNINSRVQNTQNAVYNLQSNISNTIENALEQDKNRVEDVEYKYKKIDSKAKKAILYFSAKLESVNSNPQIYLAYNEKDSTNCNEVELKKINGLTYGVEVELSLEKNYEFDIIERSTDGAEAVLNTRKYYCSLYDDFYTCRVMQNSSGGGRSNKSAGYHMYFTVNNFDLPDYEMDKVEMKVYYYNDVIKQEDITEQIVDGADQEAIEKFNLAVASGEIASNKSTEYVRRYKSENANPDTFFYQVEIEYSDYPDLKLNMDNSEAISIELIVTCKDGYSTSLIYGNGALEKKPR